MAQLTAKYYKILILIFLLSGIALQSHAWERKSDSTLYVCAGGGLLKTQLFNHIYGNDFHSGTGLGIGIQAYLKPWQEFGFGTGVLYQSRQFSLDNRIEYFNDNLESLGFASAAYQLDYISIPLKARYNFGKRFNIYIETGLQANILVSAQKHAKLDTISNFNGNPDDYIFDIKNDHHSITLSFLAGGGIEYFITPQFGLFAEYNRQRDLTQLFNYNNIAGNVHPKAKADFIQFGIRIGIPIKYSVERRFQ